MLLKKLPLEVAVVLCYFFLSLLASYRACIQGRVLVAKASRATPGFTDSTYLQMISSARDSVERNKHILSSPIKGCRKNFSSYVNELGFRFGTPGCRLESVTKFRRKCIKDGHRKNMSLHLEYFDALH